MKRTYIGLGIFVLTTVALLVWLAQYIGAIGGGAGKEYHLRLTHAAGLVENNAVKIAGVHVGRIADIAVDHDIAVLTLRVDEDIVLHEDALAIVRAKSLLGEKYLQLHPGERDTAVLEDGGQIVNVEAPFEIDEVLNALEPILGGEDSIATALAPLATTLNDLLGDASGKGGKPPIVTRDEIRQMVEDAKATMASTRRMAEDNEKSLGELVTNTNKLASDPRIPRILGRVDSMSDTLDERLPALLDKTEQTMARLEKLATIVDDDRAKKLGTVIDDASVATANLRKLSGDIKDVGKVLAPLLDDLRVLANRAKKVDEHAIRDFFQKEGMKIFVGNKREALRALED